LLGPAYQALQHACDDLIFVTPQSPDGFIDVFKIERIAHPTRISSLEPIAICRKRLNSAFDRF